jgi:hypothetical protein
MNTYISVFRDSADAPVKRFSSASDSIDISFGEFALSIYPADGESASALAQRFIDALLPIAKPEPQTPHEPHVSGGEIACGPDT